MSASMYQAGVQLDYTPTVDVAAGTIVNLGEGLVGVANVDIAANQLGALSIGGVYKVPKVGATTFAAGALAEFDVSADTILVAEDAAGDFTLGRVVYAVAAGDTFAYVLLNDRSA